ncbi:Acyl-[acyl-carrier-protein]--UDP-N-acetylglucosamine O-acyltransferase [bioreactor metagenome]|uniref:Acyl-[acyl-carrier-protein]--UDP-N-acetylglucosamine O-acyltransferase n=1 Tax=bioreactor metagenome TaxID=1076179 RepID=A0A645EKR6_9ZZZZ
MALAGFTEVHDYATIGGQCGLHQFNRIGAHCMVAAASIVMKDIPPYSLTGRNPVAFYKLNLVGLRRRGFTREQIDRIESIYRALYDSGLNVSDACVKIESDFEDSVEKRTILDFIKTSKRGIVPKVSKLMSHD